MSWLAYLTIWTAGLIGTVLALADDPGAMTGWVLLLAGAYAFALIAGVRHPEAGFFFQPLNRGPHELGTVALTFEGGPHVRVTAKLLDLLKREKVAAAFFPLGSSVAAQPDLIRRLDQEGHLLGTFVYSDRWSWRWLTQRGLSAEFERSLEAIARTARRRPRFARVPAGAAWPGLKRLLAALGQTGVCWDVRAAGSPTAEASGAAARLAQRTRNGSILALREPGPDAPEAEGVRFVETVSRTILLLRERGFSFVRLDQLLGQPGDETL